jgi:PST family polysaccharide transporter
VGLVFSVSLVLLYGVKGALVSAVTYQSVMIFVSFWMLRKLPWFNWSYFSKKIDSNISKEYFQYSVMTLVSIAVVPISQMFLRGYVISEISSEAAGCWEGMNRISNMYLSVITSSFGVYYLPRLSELHDNKSLHNEIIKSYKVIVPLLLGGLTFVYIIRSYVINILFTPEFASMKDLFIWQQIGDFFIISSWLLANLMVAKSKTILFVSTEIIASLLYVILGVIFVRLNGVVGITQAYMINYIVYMGVMAIAFRKVLIGRE